MGVHLRVVGEMPQARTDRAPGCVDACDEQQKTGAEDVLLGQRAGDRNQIAKPAILALTIAVLIGVVDESIQKVLPNRVFDPEDIVFNSLAVTMAIVASVVLNWARKRFSKSKTNNP